MRQNTSEGLQKLAAFIGIAVGILQILEMMDAATRQRRRR